MSAEINTTRGGKLCEW